MVLREIEKIRREAAEAQRKAELRAKQREAEAITREQASKFVAQQETIAIKKNYEQRKERLQAYFRKTGVLSAIEELQNSGEVKCYKKSALVFNPDYQSLTFVWGNKFDIGKESDRPTLFLPDKIRDDIKDRYYNNYSERVSLIKFDHLQDKILPVKTGLTGLTLEADYYYISIYSCSNACIRIGAISHHAFDDHHESDIQGIRRDIAQAYLGASHEKYKENIFQQGRNIQEAKKEYISPSNDRHQ
jgi:hypothetical protein